MQSSTMKKLCKFIQNQNPMEDIYAAADLNSSLSKLCWTVIHGGWVLQSCLSDSQKLNVGEFPSLKLLHIKNSLMVKMLDGSYLMIDQQGEVVSCALVPLYYQALSGNEIACSLTQLLL